MRSKDWEIGGLEGEDSLNRTRTYNISVNSRMLCQLSYQGTGPKLL